MTHNVKWQVSLNNGQTFIEGNPPYEEIAGELSPWQRLDKYITQNKLEITSLSLLADDRTFNLPSAGKNPKFKTFLEVEKPIDFWIERKVNRELKIVDNKVDSARAVGHFTIAIAVYPEYELQIWVDENNPKNSWSIVKGNNG